MNNLMNFQQNPYKEIHRGYDESFLNIRPAPEYASGEVILSSLYRSVGLPNVSEGKVPELGQKFLDKVRTGNDGQHVLDHYAWRLVLQKTLESPKLPSQSAKRFMLLCPVVPGVAAYSGSARLTKNSWNPGNLVGRMVRMGSNSNEESEGIWKRIFNDLSIDSIDDPWSDLLRREFQHREVNGEEWKYHELSAVPYLESWQSPECPANQFVQDIGKVLDLKRKLTRRQWVSIIESLLRIACVSHVMWLCKVNERAFDILRNALLGHPPGNVSEVHNSLFNRMPTTWHQGQHMLPAVRQLTREFLAARVGINYLLFLTEDKGIYTESENEEVGTLAWFQYFASLIYENRCRINSINPLRKHQSLVEDDPRLLARKLHKRFQSTV